MSDWNSLCINFNSQVCSFPPPPPLTRPIPLLRPAAASQPDQHPLTSVQEHARAHQTDPEARQNDFLPKNELPTSLTRESSLRRDSEILKA